jgi:predicted DNA-binding protein
LDDVARATERNRSWLIAKAVESYLEELEDAKTALERLGDDRLNPRDIRKALGD